VKIIKKAFLLLFLASAADTHAINPYSTSELDELEKEFVQQINLSDGIERHPLAVSYINELGNKLARASRLSKPHFFIVKSNEINAFAGPGGHIGINTRLILTTDCTLSARSNPCLSSSRGLYDRVCAG
jgi:predicted Zn-dependent protease